MLGAHWARGEANTRPRSNQQLKYHGGEVLTDASSVFVRPIFWGAKWANASYRGDKITGLTSFYNAYAASAYARTNTEYTDGSGTHVTTSISVGTAIVDSSAAPSGAPSTAQILAEVCSQITNPVVGGYYPVYTDAKRGNAGYCAWHSWGACNGVNVQFRCFFDL